MTLLIGRFDKNKLLKADSLKLSYILPAILKCASYNYSECRNFANKDKMDFALEVLVETKTYVTLDSPITALL